jgi:GT2 family glycosyltransferase
MSPVDLSVCIVSYQARAYLQDCLDSLAAHPYEGSTEVVVVDNHSHDGTLEMLSEAYPEVRAIRTREHEGYTRPMNRAMRAARGRMLLLLNPDTLVLEGALNRLVAFLESRPEVGICGPKVLNRDGSLQKPCRRSAARPWDVLSYFSGLADRFPHDRRFSGYYMGYMDEDETHEVEGVSGSCMLIRREVVDHIGFLDERFYAYQEDADYCFRARAHGWQIYYVPAAEIIHYGGQGGSRVHPYRSIFEWHKSYWLYYRKNLARDYLFLFNWIYYLAMGLKLLGSLALNLVRREKVAGGRKA